MPAHMLTLAFPGGPQPKKTPERTPEPTTYELLLIGGLFALGVVACVKLAQGKTL